MRFKRYDIHRVNLDPVRGSELRKTRPSRALQTVVICPLTTQVHPEWRARLMVKIAGKPAEIVADQIRAVSKSRLGRKMGASPRQTLRVFDACLARCTGLARLGLPRRDC